MIRAIRCVVLVMGVTAAAFVAGCKTDAPPIGGEYDVPGPYPSISLSNGSLRDAVKFQTPIVTRTPNGNMSVTLPLRANSKQTLHIEYRVIWFDGAHRVIPPEMAWAPVRLEPRQQQQISVASSSDAAVDYNIQVRWGKP